MRYDKRRKTWNYLWYDGRPADQRIGTKQEHPTKAAVWAEVERREHDAAPVQQKGETVQSIVARDEVERMPARHSTARVYRSFLKNHVLPKWGETAIQVVQPRPVELWLRELTLSPKSKTHVRSLRTVSWSCDVGRSPGDGTQPDVSCSQERGDAEGTQAFRHTYRSWLHAVGTGVAVQQKMMRHADIRTTFNIYGDVVTDEMTTVGIKVAQMVFTNGAESERRVNLSC